MTAWVCKRTDDLTHHGIKGQKWGVRRFQNEDGTLTNAGKKRYDDTSKEYKSPDKKSKHRTNLEEKYVAKGFSKEDAELLANGRIKTEKILAVTAGTTIAVAAAYVANKQLKYRVDSTIKKGSELQRIAKTGKTDLKGALYTSYDKNDNVKYAGKFAFGRMDDTGSAQKMNIKVTDNIKVASRKHAEDTFIELFKNDKEFQRNAIESIDMAKTFAMPASEHKIIEKVIKNPNVVKDSDLRKSVYDAFNIGLGLKTDEATKSADTFYETLSKKGYNAVKDVNDMTYSSFKTKAPTILFDSNNKIKLDSIEQLTEKMIRDNMKKASNIAEGQVKTEQILSNVKELTKYAGGVAAGANILTVANLKVVEQYRKEHPNSKLTDKEILEMRKERR